jgi:hypothetical protein
LAPAFSGLLALAALALAVPALASGHSHEHDGDHEHVDAAGHAHGDEAAAAHGHDSDGDAAHAHEAGEDGHAHDATMASGDGHGHGTGFAAAAHGHSDGSNANHAHDPAASGGHQHPTTGDPGHEHPPGTDPPDHEHPPDDEPTGPIISLDDPRLTPAQRAAAVELINISKFGMLRFPNVAAVEAAGYRSIGDGGSNGYEHFVHWGYLTDGYEMHPGRIESVVAKKNGDGTKTVVSAMYILNLGKTMAQVPDIAGELTTWHDHKNLCWEVTPVLRIVGVTGADGKCARGVNIHTPPMLHVWMVPHPCGPFAGIDGHGGNCGTHEH